MMYVGIIGSLVGIDLYLKQKIEAQSPEKFPRELPKSKGKIKLHRNHNPGFSFGFMEKYPKFIQMVPLAVVSGFAGVLAYLCSRKGRVVSKVGLSILISGGLSNLYDRLVRNYVVDYFSFELGFLKKVVFNLGDLFVLLGSLIFLVADFLQEFNKKSS